MAAGSLAFGADSFAVMLVSGYAPDKAGHNEVADVTGEVTGTGYTAGGAVVGVVVDIATADRADIELGGATWPASTISATGAVYYQQAADMLVAYIDFGGMISSLAGSFTLQPSTISIHNP
jgi:hypothetical protein